MPRMRTPASPKSDRAAMMERLLESAKRAQLYELALKAVLEQAKSGEPNLAAFVVPYVSGMLAK